jgi:hypothetical protein
VSDREVSPERDAASFSQLKNTVPDKLLDPELLVAVSVSTRGKLTENDTIHLLKHAAVFQLREQTIYSIRSLVDILQEENRISEIRTPWRAA